MRRLWIHYDDMTVEVMDLAMAVKRDTGRYPDLLHIGPSSAKMWNLEAGIWRLDNGTWIWVRPDDGSGFTPEMEMGDV